MTPKTVAGILRSEENGQLRIEAPDTQSITVQSSDIGSRTPLISAMPPMTTLLTPRQEWARAWRTVQTLWNGGRR